MKHLFIDSLGNRTETDAFMKGPCTKGTWHNCSKLEDDYITWVEGTPLDSVDLNTDYLFGYEREEFMRKQYR